MTANARHALFPVAGLVVAGAATVLIVVTGTSLVSNSSVAGVIAFCHANWWAFAAAYLLVICTGLLPASALVMAAGAIYGFGWGVAMASIFTLIGAGLSFAICRSFLRPVSRAVLRSERLKYIDKKIAADGWRFVFLLRISPLMPFSATNFLLGLSSVRFRDYVIGTLGAMPAMVAYVFAGALSREGYEAYRHQSDFVSGAILVAGAVGTIVLFAYAHRAIVRPFASAVANPREV